MCSSEEPYTSPARSVTSIALPLMLDAKQPNVVATYRLPEHVVPTAT